MSSIAVCSGEMILTAVDGGYSYVCSVPMTELVALHLTMSDAALLSSAVAASFALGFVFRTLFNQLRR